MEAPKEDESFEYALTIARLEQELQEIENREKQVELLSKQQDGLIKSKKEIKHKFDAIDTYLSDFAKVIGGIQVVLRSLADSQTTNAVTRKIKDIV
jgi:hypothetical protein